MKLTTLISIVLGALVGACLVLAGYIILIDPTETTSVGALLFIAGISYVAKMLHAEISRWPKVEDE